MSAVDPNLSPVIVIPAGGGAALPTDDPTAVFAGLTPDSFLVVDGDGNGAAVDAAEARERLADTTVYDFASASGVTLVNGTVGGSAAVTGGLLRLTCPGTPAARYFAGNLEAPYGQVAVPLDDGGRRPLHWRALVRVVAVGTGAVARLIVVGSGGQRVGIYAGPDGSGGAEDNVGLGSYGTFVAASLPVGGTGWLEIEVIGAVAAYRYGTGTAVAPPSAWTEIGVATLPAVASWTAVRLVGSTNSAPGSTTVVDFDDLVIEAL